MPKRERWILDLKVKSSHRTRQENDHFKEGDDNFSFFCFSKKILLL
jgi:hypothetical protein